ncbi:MAG: carbohydrate ABC transporter permease, partial [Gammaproteobacteria bacterium]
MNGRWLTLTLRYLGLLGLALIFIAPILFMLAGSFKPDARVLTEAGQWQALVPSGATLQNYRDVFTRVDFTRYLLNSLFITASVVILGLVVNSLAGYAFARLSWRGRQLLFAAVLAILILPLEAIAVPLFYEVTRFGWRDTYLVQILPFVANA